MLRALESGTAGLHVPTGEVREFPDQHQRRADQRRHLRDRRRGRAHGAARAPHCGAEPACYMTGGAGWKMAPVMNGHFELVESLIMDGLLVIARERAIG